MSRHRHRWMHVVQRISAVETRIVFNAVCYYCGKPRMVPVIDLQPTFTA